MQLPDRYQRARVALTEPHAVCTVYGWMGFDSSGMLRRRKVILGNMVFHSKRHERCFMMSMPFNNLILTTRWKKTASSCLG